MQYPTNPKYSARHYDDLAEFVKTDVPVGDIWSAKRRVAERLADRFAADNPAFDRERFLEGCGLEP